MEALITRIFTNNWQRKAAALITAIIMWLFVNHSIIETKVIPSIPIRVINLPADKTILGLLPNGLLSRRITLTLSGTKDVINELESGDLEVLLDASTVDKDDWVVQITKKNLISLNSSIDLLHHITHVSHSELVIKLSRLVTAKIPVYIMTPIGESPPGYEFLDVWPQLLTQTLSGPEEAIQKLQKDGLQLTFDLSKISKADLDSIKSSHLNFQEDEISFLVPSKWKDIAIPFQNNVLEELNDPEAENLRIDFLRKELHSIGKEIPIELFYPMKYSEHLNPETLSLAIEPPVKKVNGIPVLNQQLYFYEVSRLFLDIVRENLSLVIIAAPSTEREFLQWSLEIVDPRESEDMYVAVLAANSNSKNQIPLSKSREEMLRRRFREYLRKASLYVALDKKLILHNRIEGNLIHINTP